VKGLYFVVLTVFEVKFVVWGLFTNTFLVVFPADAVERIGVISGRC